MKDRNPDDGLEFVRVLPRRLCVSARESVFFFRSSNADVRRRGLEQSRRDKGADHEETLAHLAALEEHLRRKS